MPRATTPSVLVTEVGLRAGREFFSVFTTAERLELAGVLRRGGGWIVLPLAADPTIDLASAVDEARHTLRRLLAQEMRRAA